MFGCQPTFSFLKASGTQDLFQCCRKLYVFIQYHQGATCVGKRSRPADERDLRNRQREEGTGSLGSASQQQSGRTGWKQKLQREWGKGTKETWLMSWVCFSTMRNRQRKFPISRETELRKVEARWEKGQMGRQRAVGMAHFLTLEWEVGLFVGRCWWKKTAFRVYSERCTKETQPRVSQRRHSIWTQVQKIGSSLGCHILYHPTSHFPPGQTECYLCMSPCASLRPECGASCPTSSWTLPVMTGQYPRHTVFLF